MIGGITRHEFFPMPLEAVPAVFDFHQVEPGVEFVIDGFHITPIALNHPFGSVGYRIDGDGSSWAYVADTAPFDPGAAQAALPARPRAAVRRRQARAGGDARGAGAPAVGVDTVVYDTHFLPDEYAKFPHYGHSTPDQAIEICAEASARRLVLYHHAPSHGDDQMDRIAAEYLRRAPRRTSRS